MFVPELRYDNASLDYDISLDAILPRNAGLHLRETSWGVSIGLFATGKGSGTNSAKHPKGRSGYWYLTRMALPLST
jgi:hypothetical protein